MNIEEQIKELELQNKENLNQIKQLKEKLSKQSKTKSYSIPRAKWDGVYIYLNYLLNVDYDTDIYGDSDLESYESFNYFTDENEAKRYSEYMKLTIELFRIRDLINNGWQPDWNDINQEKYCASFLQNESGSIKTINGFVFGTEEDMQKFIDTVGKEKIKKYIQF